MNTKLIGIAMLAFGLTACGERNGTATASNETAAASAPIALGTTGHAQGVDMTVTDVTTPKQIGMAGMGPKAEATETFVVVAYTIKNTAAKALPLTERPTFSLVDGGGHTYEPDPSGTMMAAGMMKDPSGMASDLNPNVSAKTMVAWKIDKKAFDKAAWKVVAATDPALTFALK